MYSEREEGGEREGDDSQLYYREDRWQGVERRRGCLGMFSYVAHSPPLPQYLFPSSDWLPLVLNRAKLALIGSLWRCHTW